MQKKMTEREQTLQFWGVGFLNSKAVFLDEVVNSVVHKGMLDGKLKPSKKGDLAAARSSKA